MTKIVIADTPMGVMEFDSATGFTVAPARVESPYPNWFRMARYPEGQITLQGSYAWSQGSEGGVIWKDLPIVDVDDEGKEL